MSTHIMVDLETLGLDAGNAVIAIGAAAFVVDGAWVDLTDPGSALGFYVEINAASAADAGLVIDPNTVMWWQRQEPYARGLFDRVYLQGGGEPILNALSLFSEWAGRFSDARIWGNGAEFDNALLKEAYRRACNYPPPWGFKNSRCYRTLRAIRPDIAVEYTKGAQHNAFFDALDQARHAQALMHALGTVEI